MSFLTIRRSRPQPIIPTSQLVIPSKAGFHPHPLAWSLTRT